VLAAIAFAFASVPLRSLLLPAMHLTGSQFAFGVPGAELYMYMASSIFQDWNHSVLGILGSATAVAGVAGADDDEGLTRVLRQVVVDNLAAFNGEDVSATMQSIHSKSPEYTSMQQALPNQFSALDARTELVSFRYIGHDDEFAVARVKLKTVDESDEQFMANVLDTITIFHQEDGAWKYWSNHVLGVEPVK